MTPEQKETFSIILLLGALGVIMLLFGWYLWYQHRSFQEESKLLDEALGLRPKSKGTQK